MPCKNPTKRNVPICVAEIPLLTKYAVENLSHGTADAVVMIIKILAATTADIFVFNYNVNHIYYLFYFFSSSFFVKYLYIYICIYTQKVNISIQLIVHQ